MKKIIFGMLFLVLMIGLVFAAQGSGNARMNSNSENCTIDEDCDTCSCGINQDCGACSNPRCVDNKCVYGDETVIGGQRDEHGCLIAAGYSWNETEEKCVREWEQGEDRYQNEEQGLGQEIRNRVRAGVYTSEAGEEIRVSEMAQNRLRLNVNNVSADCDCNLSEEKIQNKTRLKIQLSNGRNAEIKIMPDKASENALNMLKLKVCSEENKCSIELKEVGEGEEIRLAYELQTEREAKIMGLLKANIQVKAQVDAESGEVIQIEKPWWAFLASESEE